MKTRSLLNLCICLITATAAAQSGSFKVTDFGAVGDGTTLGTAAIQKAIDACSSKGGGAVVFPAGRYLSGTIQLKDNVTLRLDENAVLLGSPNAADYQNLDPFIDGVGQELGFALVVALDAKHVGIEGAGAIDGQGKALKAAQKPFKIRPFLVRWVRCTDITVQDVRLSNPGAWTMNFFQCKNAAVSRVNIRTRDQKLANNDGIDVDSCQGVRITGCDIISGDDAVVLKATSTQACSDIFVTGCKLSSSANAFKLGTESIGDFERIEFHDSKIYKTGISGIALNSVDGSHLHDVKIDGVTMDGVAAAISIRLGARLKTFRKGDQAKPPGILRDVIIKNVNARGIKKIGILINGIPGHPVENLTLENIALELPGGGTAADAAVQLQEKEAAYPEWSMFGKVIPASGAYVRHARGIVFKNVRATLKKPDARPPAVFIDVEGATPTDFSIGS
jgi:polygalacturonase